MSPLEPRPDSPAEAPEEPQILVSTREEISGSGIRSRRGLRTRHRLERNPERPLATRMEIGLSRGQKSGSLMFLS